MNIGSTMNKEILVVVDMVSNEKGVNKDVIFNALECAIASATKKNYEHEVDISVHIDRKTGGYKAFRRWQVVADENIESPELQISLTDAITENPDINLGELFEAEIESVGLDRIGAQTAKQVIVQKIREAERQQIVEAYEDKQGDLISGSVKRIVRGNVIIDLGGHAEALITREDMIHRESVRIGDHLRGYLQTVRSEPRGPQLFLSRTAPEFLIKLFALEVPEIGENIIEIVSASRDPGLRAKIAVRTNDGRVDLGGGCIIKSGSRVAAISNELAGERVDIIVWDENPAQFVINAMSPAEVVSIIVDEDNNTIDVAVQEEQLSLAIGRSGQNVRLASQLTGWNLNVMTEAQAEEKHEKEAIAVLKMLMSNLDIEEDIASVLVQEGFSSLEEIAYVPLQEMLEIQEFDENIVKELRQRAKKLLQAAALKEEEEKKVQVTEELRTMAGMNDELAQQMARHGFLTMNDLAEQSVDDLLILDGMDEKQAGELIMTARASWFQ